MKKDNFFDGLETRNKDERNSDHLNKLNKLIEQALNNKNQSSRLNGKLNDLKDLSSIPLLRKSELTDIQNKNLPFANLNVSQIKEFAHIYRSPGPIYDLDGHSQNWWRFARALYAADFGYGDIVQNCFSYHFTPAGAMFEEAAKILKCTVFPAGGESTDLQLEVMKSIGTTAYVGVPDFLKIILEKSDEMKVSLPKLKKAMVTGGPLFPAVANNFKERNIQTRQCYGTADLGLIAYEAAESDGMIIDEDVILEIVKPGTGKTLQDGEVGEVVVTVLNNFELPIIRFATGDLSAILDGESSTGRTNKRIKGWMGRADQTTKVKGMFVQPSQINQILENLKISDNARMIVSRENDRDELLLKIESSISNSLEIEAMQNKVSEEIKNIINLRGLTEIVPVNSLPNDGKVIDDIRDFGG
ncbi:AMP-binding protein [Alphaproteobacteria bacterium]|nr:AMP-binding protein [Alphaproteobacteria bacterium]MDC1023168.1 AMP-binding protein [Alphaproteobacteria bacterium]